MADRHWRKSGDRMRELREDRRSVGLVETTVWVPAGRAGDIREWAWGWCEEHLDATGQREVYERRRRESLDRDSIERGEAVARAKGRLFP